MGKNMNLEEKIASGYYEGNRYHYPMEDDYRYYYPMEDDYRYYYIYKKGKCITHGTKAQVINALNMDWENIKVRYTIEKDFNEKGFHKGVDLYRNEQKRKRIEFRDDLMKYFGYNQLPDDVQSTIFSYVWEKGHSAGYHEVFIEMCDLVSMIDKILHHFKMDKT